MLGGPRLSTGISPSESFPGNEIVAGVAGMFGRVRKSAVIWSWALNSVRLASAILLLPLLMHKLPKPEFGMYYVFLSITALQPFLDLGFSSAIGRFVSYAVAGATTLQAQGVAPPSGPGKPNFTLLWQLLRTTGRLYLYTALAGFTLMGIWGTIQVGLNVKETVSPRFTWFAWGLTLACAGFEMYSLWWNAFLFYLNRVQDAMRVAFFSYLVRICLACALLLLGWGLAAWPAAGFVGCFLNRHFSRHGVLRAMGTAPAEAVAMSQGSLLRLMWPNSWRLALQLFSNWLRTNANTAICAPIFGLVKTGEYGLSLQAMNISSGMASVWSQVKWPQVAQQRSTHDWAGMRRTLWPRIWLQTLTFLVLAAAAVLLGPPLLKILGKDKQLIATPWLVLLAASALLDMTYMFWGTLLSVENRIPTLWAAVAANLGCLALAFGLSRYTSIGVPSLVLAPFLSGIVFNFWYWPLAGARMLRTTWWRFMLCGPQVGEQGATAGQSTVAAQELESKR